MSRFKSVAKVQPRSSVYHFPRRNASSDFTIFSLSDFSPVCGGTTIFCGPQTFAGQGQSWNYHRSIMIASLFYFLTNRKKNDMPKHRNAISKFHIAVATERLNPNDQASHVKHNSNRKRRGQGPGTRGQRPEKLVICLKKSGGIWKNLVPAPCPWPLVPGPSVYSLSTL